MGMEWEVSGDQFDDLPLWRWGLDQGGGGPDEGVGTLVKNAWEAVKHGIDRAKGDTEPMDHVERVLMHLPKMGMVPNGVMVEGQVSQLPDRMKMAGKVLAGAHAAWHLWDDLPDDPVPELVVGCVEQAGPETEAEFRHQTWLIHRFVLPAESDAGLLDGIQLAGLDKIRRIQKPEPYASLVPDLGMHGITKPHLKDLKHRVKRLTEGGVPKIP